MVKKKRNLILIQILLRNLKTDKLIYYYQLLKEKDKRQKS